MAFSKLSDQLDALTAHVEQYVNSTLAYYKLSLFKQLMKAFSSLTKLLVLGSFFLVFLGFVSVGLAILIGKAIGDVSLGFFIVGGFYFLVFLVLWAVWKNCVEKFFLQKFSKLVFADDEEETSEESPEENTGNKASSKTVDQ